MSLKMASQVPKTDLLKVLFGPFSVFEKKKIKEELG